jgi:hypothetical protein
MKRHQRGVVVLVAAALMMLGVAAALARCSDDRLGVTLPTVRPIEFPRERALKEARQQRRGASQSTPAPSATPEVKSRDRLLRALSSPGKDGAVVVEVNALRHSPLVDALIKCRAAQNGSEQAGFELLKDELGIDVTEDVDRVALDPQVLAVSGFFENLKVPPEAGEGQGYGDAGRIFSVPGDKGKPAYVATVGNDLVMTGTDVDELKAAVDRAEGRGEAPATFPEGTIGGEVYGVVGASLVRSIVALGGDGGQFDGVLDMLTTSKVRMAVDTDAALSLDIGTKSPSDGAELAKALGGAVALARSRAAADGEAELAAMLEQAKIVPNDDGSIAFDVAVPGDDLLKLMGCPPLSRVEATAPTNQP